MKDPYPCTGPSGAESKSQGRERRRRPAGPVVDGEHEGNRGTETYRLECEV